MAAAYQAGIKKKSAHQRNIKRRSEAAL